MSFSDLFMLVAITASFLVVRGNVCQVTNIVNSSNVVGSYSRYITSPAVPDTALVLVAASNSTTLLTTFTVVRQTVSSGMLTFDPICLFTYAKGAPPFVLAADGSIMSVQLASIPSELRVHRLPATDSTGSIPLCSAAGSLGPILSGAIFNSQAALLSSAFTPPASNNSLAAMSLLQQKGSQRNDVVCITITGGSSVVTDNCLRSVSSSAIASNQLGSFTAVSESEYLYFSAIGRFMLIRRAASVTPHLTDAFVTVLQGAMNTRFTPLHSATVTSANRGLLGLSVEWVGSTVVVLSAQSPSCGAQVIIPSSGVDASWLSVNITNAVLPDSASEQLTELCEAGAIDVAIMSGGLQFVSLDGEARTLYVTPSCSATGGPPSTSSPNTTHPVPIRPIQRSLQPLPLSGR